MPDDASARPHPARTLSRRVVRREDDLLLRGAGRYVDDLREGGALAMFVLRADRAPGRVVNVDAGAAEGAVAVLTAADLEGLGRASVNPLVPGMEARPASLLAAGRVEAVGQAVAAVVAETREAARDAAEAILVEVEETEFEPAREALSARHREGDVKAAFADAEHVVEVAVEHARVSPFPLEPRCALARPEPGDGLTIWLSTQTPHRARADLAAILGLAPERIRVVAPDVGGAFGGKASLYPEDALVALAALRLGRPVRWTATRGEDLLSATQGRGGRLRGRLALDASGRFIALEADIRFPLGAWTPYSAAVPARNAARILPGPYDVPAVDIRMSAEFTPDAPMNIYRGAGRPEATMLMERLGEAAARATGLDAAELRARNLVRPEALPRATPTGETLDASDFPRLLERVCALGRRDALIAARDAARAEGRLAGVGLALYVEPCGAGFETARLAIRRDGGIVATTGSTAQGQGRETATAQLVAARLGRPVEAVTVWSGDTGAIADGVGALASRSTAIGASALSEACAAFEAGLRALAAELMQCDPARVVPMEDGFTHDDGPIAAVVGWPDLGAAACDRAGAEEGLVIDHRYDASAEAWASGAVLASAEIDPETGEPTLGPIHWVDDAGVVLNPLLVEGQLLGGLAQGLGEALMERIVYDGAQLATGSLMDYQLPRAADIPPVLLESAPTPSAANPLGAKGVGEAGCIGVPAAVANAVLDALAPLGVTRLNPPMTAARIWEAMRTGRDAREPR